MIVCPTYVGMNRSQHVAGPAARCMPHVCGDEPAAHDEQVETLRMPHVCGDEPHILAYTRRIVKYAPRMWG